MKKLFDNIFDRCAPLSFTKIGYHLRKKLFEWDQNFSSLQGKHIAITGPTSGLGLAMSKQLAAQQSKLYLLARNIDTASQVAEQLDQIAPGSVQDIIHLDLADFDSVREAAKKLNQLKRLDFLIHNAGGLHKKRLLTKNGLELTFATHVLAPHLLTKEILPLLKKSTNPKVITVASGGLYTQKIDIHDLQSRKKYSGTAAYAKAKRMQTVLAEHWAQLEPSVAFHTMHPGWCATPGLAKSLPLFSKLCRPLLRTPEQGIETILWLASQKNQDLQSGTFWFDRRERPTDYLSKTKTSPMDKQTVWKQMTELTDKNT